jgi:hypothetical protein
MPGSLPYELLRRRLLIRRLFGADSLTLEQRRTVAARRRPAAT